MEQKVRNGPRNGYEDVVLGDSLGSGGLEVGLGGLNL